MNQYSSIPAGITQQTTGNNDPAKTLFVNQVLNKDDRDWQTFFGSFTKLGKEEINSRQKDINRLLKENGVTYNIYGDPSGENRLWSLDLVPFLIGKKEWDYTEKRARSKGRGAKSDPPGHLWRSEIDQGRDYPDGIDL